jgi:hypothetical protein
MKKKFRIHFNGQPYFIAPSKNGYVFGRSDSKIHVTMYSRPEDGILCDWHLSEQFANVNEKAKTLFRFKEGDSPDEYIAARKELHSILARHEVESGTQFYVISEDALRRIFESRITESNNEIKISINGEELVELLREEDFLLVTKEEFLESSYDLGFLEGEYVQKIAWVLGRCPNCGNNMFSLWGLLQDKITTIFFQRHKRYKKLSSTKLS